MNVFPKDFKHTLTGFGGDPNLNREEHRASIKKTPVILIHGNAANVSHSKWGWYPIMRGFLKDEGYQDSEIWAMNYLGENRDLPPELPSPVRDHIIEVRKFIDDVIAYLNVKRVDIISHSLGGMMTTAYLKGFKSDGTWENTNNKLDRVGTAVYLASNNYGMYQQPLYGEFQIGSDFEVNSHKFEGINEDTPKGINDPKKMVAPEESWKVTTIKDADTLSPQVKYVAIIAINDFVDQQSKDTSRLNGADLNQRFNLGPNTDGHEKIIKDRGVFDSFKIYLNEYPPVSPVNITVDKENGNYLKPLSIVINVDPKDKTVSYIAKCINKEFVAGYIVETARETLNGELKNGKKLTISTDGIWEVAFSCPGASDIKRVYGVSVAIPIVEIITPNTSKFTGSREVQAQASNGKLYFSFDGKLFNEGSTIRISESHTVYFIAIDNGKASEIVSRYYEKAAAWTEQASGTPTNHYIAQRITLDEYINIYGPKYHWINTYTMYKINGEWTDNPDIPVSDTVAPTISFDKEEGTYEGVLKLRIAAIDDYDAEPILYWTKDGSTPTVNSSHRANYVDLIFDAKGKYKVKTFSKDASGNSSDIITKEYTVKIPQNMPTVKSDPATGEYTQPIDVTITAPGAIAYYTTDGSEPSTRSPSFTERKLLSISGNGGHTIKVLAIKKGNRVIKEFNYSINDTVHVKPDTAISSFAGGTFVNSVQVMLTPDKLVEWTKYTTDGTDPSDTNGTVYMRVFTLKQGCTLKWRSKDKQGILEDIHSAVFTITNQKHAVYDNNKIFDGYVKANSDGHSASVGTFGNLAIGSGSDGKHNRAILHFDTSSIPDNAVIGKAYLEVEYYSGEGNVFSQGNIKVAIKKGYFGISKNVQADDFSSAATAVDVAEIAYSPDGKMVSTMFNEEGLNAINKTGITQVRLEPPVSLSADNYMFIKEGAHAKLYIDYN